MRVERCHHLHLLLITVSLACLLTGCGDSRYEQMRSRMAAIDSLNSHYQPFSVDSVSEMADYFESHGTPHDRIMAYYLLGSAFRDASEAPAALKVEDSAGSGQPTYYGAFHFDDGADSDLEYAYDQNGNMTKDLNKDITEIKYNLMNLPAKITYSDGKSLSFTYSANGERLSVTHNMVYTGDFNAYFGHFIYRNGSLNRVLVDGGYIYSSQYHFYLTDHLGNNRVVVNAGGTVEQVNHYYPYGGLMGESSGGSVQPYKYNGKELERMNGLDLYDYGARWMDAALGRFTTMDPLCEKYYSISPYAYCGGNPVKFIDPDGRTIDDIYYNENGDELYRVKKDGPDNYYVIKTTKKTSEIYTESASSEKKGWSKPISEDDAYAAEVLIMNGDITGEHMKNVTSMCNSYQMNGMLNSIKDDGKGGTSPNNNREYFGNFTSAGVKDTKEGLVGDPSKGQHLISSGNPNYHSHPSGTKKSNIEGYSHAWQQGPSPQDIRTAMNL